MIGIITNTYMSMPFNGIDGEIEIIHITVDNDENDTVIEDTVMFESYEYNHNNDPLDSDGIIWVKENSDLHKYLESNVYQDVMFGSAKHYKEYRHKTIGNISVGRVGSVYDSKNDFYNNFIIIKDATKTRIKKYADNVFKSFILLSVMNIRPSIMSKDKDLVNDQTDFVYVRGVNQNIVDTLLDNFNTNISTRNGNTNVSDVLLYTGPNKFDFFCDIFKLVDAEDILNKKVSVLAHLKY